MPMWRRPTGHNPFYHFPGRTLLLPRRSIHSPPPPPPLDEPALSFHRSMKSDNNSSDRRLHELVPVAAATVAAFADTTKDNKRNDDRDEDQELDLEVSRFLEAEFFTDPSDDGTPSRQRNVNESSSALPWKEEMLFMDINDSIDIPDLDFGDVSEAFGQFRMSADSPVQEDSSIPKQTPAPSHLTTTEDLKPTNSLRVLIPASALFAPRPAARQNEQAMAITPRTTRNTGRKRVKDELEYLRQQVSQFESKLEMLRRGSNAQGSPPSSSLSASNMFESQLFSEATPHSTLWERIAKHQMHEKQKSEVANIKLKEMLEHQLKVAQSLSRVLRKRQDLSWLETLQEGQPKKKLCMEAESDETVFTSLAAEIESLYSELDTVLCEAGLSGPETELHGGQVKTDEGGNVYLEVVDCSALAFSVGTTGAAFWKLMSSPTIKLGQGEYQTIDFTEDTVRARVSMTLRVREEDTVIQLRLIGKRVVEADRVILVWCTKGETQGCLFGKECVQVRERGWVVIKAAVGSTANPDEETKDNQQQHQSLTIMQSVVRMTPELEVSDSGSPSSADHVGVLTDVVLSSFQQNFAALHQMVENIVLTDVREASC